MKRRAAAVILSLAVAMSSTAYGGEVSAENSLNDGVVVAENDIYTGSVTDTQPADEMADLSDLFPADVSPEDGENEESSAAEDGSGISEEPDAAQYTVTEDGFLEFETETAGQDEFIDLDDIFADPSEEETEDVFVIPSPSDLSEETKEQPEEILADEIELDPDILQEEGITAEDPLKTDPENTLSAGDKEADLSGEVNAADPSLESGVTQEVGATNDSRYITVDVSSWVSTSKGWMLKKPATAAGGSTSYYTFADGFLKVKTNNGSTGISHEAWYRFNNEGVMLTGRQIMKDEATGSSYTAYFMDADTAELYTEFSSQKGALTPYNSNLGKRRYNYWLYNKKTNRFAYFDDYGHETSISELVEKNKDIGYFKIRGKYYLLDAAGTPQVYMQHINGEYYYFKTRGEIPGQMFTSGWKRFTFNGKERWVYYQMLNAGAKRGQAVRHGRPYPAELLQKSKKYKFLLDVEGYILKSTHVLCENGKYYGSDSKGRIRRNQLATYDGERYYFTDDGSQATYQNQWVFLKNANNRYYYFGNTPGKVDKQQGIRKVTVNGQYMGWYYFDSKGNMVRNQMIDGRYYGESGRMASGILTVDGKPYFFQSSTESECKGTMYQGTLIHYQDNYYYATDNGTLFKEGTVRIDGDVYYFKDYKMQFNTFTWNGDTFGYITSSGKFVTGWVIESNAENKARYVDPAGTGFYTDTSVVIDGLRYYFDRYGLRMNDVTSIYTGPYYVRVDRVNGVMTVYDSSRTVPVKSMRVSVGLPSTPTPTGTYTLYRSARWQALMGPSWGQYGTHVYGAGLGGIFVHSIACSYANSYNVPASAYNMLGYPASHGCIRVCVADAKWVYDHCNGATITIFDGNYNANEAMKGPLGRRALVPMTGSYDPTDPAV